MVYVMMADMDDEYIISKYINFWSFWGRVLCVFVDFWLLGWVLWIRWGPMNDLFLRRSWTWRDVLLLVGCYWFFSVVFLRTLWFYLLVFWFSFRFQWLFFRLSFSRLLIVLYFIPWICFISVVIRYTACSCCWDPGFITIAFWAECSCPVGSWIICWDGRRIRRVYLSLLALWLVARDCPRKWLRFTASCLVWWTRVFRGWAAGWRVRWSCWWLTRLVWSRCCSWWVRCRCWVLLIVRSCAVWNFFRGWNFLFQAVWFCFWGFLVLLDRIFLWLRTICAVIRVTPRGAAGFGCVGTEVHHLHEGLVCFLF